MDKCSWGNNVSIKPDGINELDPCMYEQIAKYKNVTVVINKCIKCGHIEIGWIRQANTEMIEETDEAED